MESSDLKNKIVSALPKIAVGAVVTVLLVAVCVGLYFWFKKPEGFDMTKYPQPDTIKIMSTDSNGNVTTFPNFFNDLQIQIDSLRTQSATAAQITSLTNELNTVKNNAATSAQITTLTNDFNTLKNNTATTSQINTLTNNINSVSSKADGIINGTTNLQNARVTGTLTTNTLTVLSAIPTATPTSTTAAPATTTTAPR